MSCKECRQPLEEWEVGIFCEGCSSLFLEDFETAVCEGCGIMNKEMAKPFMEKIAKPGKATLFNVGVRVGHKSAMKASYYGAAKESEALERFEWLKMLVEKYPTSFGRNT